MPQRTAAVVARSESANRAAVDHASGGIERLFREFRERETGDEETRQAVLRELDGILAEVDVATLCRGLSEADLNSELGTAILARWLSADPVSAAGWLASHPALDHDQVGAIAGVMAGQPRLCEQIEQTLPAGELKDTFLATESLAIADTAPANAATLAMCMTSENARADTLETIAYAWSVRDAATAEQWISSIDDPALRERLFASGAKALATSDPDLAASWLDALPPTPIRAETTLAVMEAWAAKDPAAAASWVAGFNSAELRVSTAVQVMKAWAVSDPNRATAWLLSLPERQQILARLAAEKAERALVKD